MAWTTKASITINPAKLRVCLAESPKYEAYALSIGNRIRAAAIAVFEVEQVRGNGLRLSNRTPPKYVSSFRVRYMRKTLSVRVTNTDPGWATVEFGFHPGGNEEYVPAMKPLRRGLLSVAIF